jgi:sporulation protein YlmC with PRC-barrel domain
MEREVRVEHLLSRRVYALNGRAIGRIEEIRAEVKENECLIAEYLIGNYAWLERLAAWNLGRSILRIVQPRKQRRGYRVPWDQVDLTDIARPRLCCQVANLIPLQE